MERPYAKLASDVGELSRSLTQLDLANSAVEHIFTLFYYNHITPEKAEKTCFTIKMNANSFPGLDDFKKK